ncbi:MAG: SpoIIE family protein phosphatase [Roseivirga sp.]|nr:SpoIIE family protein phosphatase [Roseivirga sp.]
MIESSYQLVSNTLAKPGKRKNGDYCKTVDSSTYVLALVADGITSLPCDWKASKTACENLTSYVQKQIKTAPDPEKLLYESISQVNKDLLYETEECDGLATTLCGLFWLKETNHVHYFWLGDSRIYFYKVGKLHQISEDDSEEFVSSKDISPGASVYSRNIITNSLGRSDCRIRVKKHPFEPGDGLIMATDGFIESTASFEQKLINCINAADFEKPIADILQQNRVDQRDDSTIAILRRTYDKITNTQIAEFLNDKQSAPDLFYELQAIYAAIVLGINTGQDEICLNALRRIDERNLKLGKKALLNLLDLVVATNYKGAGLYNALVLLIRKSE